MTKHPTSTWKISLALLAVLAVMSSIDAVEAAPGGTPPRGGRPEQNNSRRSERGERREDRRRGGGRPENAHEKNRARHLRELEDALKAREAAVAAREAELLRALGELRRLQIAGALPNAAAHAHPTFILPLPHVTKNAPEFSAPERIFENQTPRLDTEYPLPDVNFDTTAMNHYLRQVLKVSPDQFVKINRTLGALSAIYRGLEITAPGASEAQREQLIEQSLLRRFAADSLPTLRKTLKGLARENSNNVLILGESGVGKTFTIEQLIALLSYGMIPGPLSDEFDFSSSRFPSPTQDFTRGFLGKTQFIALTADLFALDNTKEGEAWANALTRQRHILSQFFEAATKDFKTQGIRTVFILDEFKTYDEHILNALLPLLGDNGFPQSTDPLQVGSDLGYSALAITTPLEWVKVRTLVPALPRRFFPVTQHEPNEIKAAEIAKKEIERLSKLYQPEYQSALNIPDEVIDFIISMRRFYPDPSIAFPDSSNKQVKAFFNWCLERKQKGVIKNRTATRENAWSFFVEQAGLPKEVWDPADGDPLYDLAERVKALNIDGRSVIDLDVYIDRIAAGIQAAMLTGFKKIPVFILGGMSGSGKDSLAWAFNQVLFGHSGDQMNFSLKNNIDRILVQGPGGTDPTLKLALTGEQKSSVILLNELRDAPNEDIRTLKPLTETGEFLTEGKEPSRVRLGINILFLAGEYAEREMAHLEEDERDLFLDDLTEKQLDQIFMDGAGDGKHGELSRSLLDRSRATGGVMIVRPIRSHQYFDLADPIFDDLTKQYQKTQSAQIIFDDSFKETVVVATQKLKIQVRQMKGMLNTLATRPIILAQGKRTDEKPQLRLSGARLRFVSRGKDEITLIDETSGRAKTEYVYKIAVLLQRTDQDRCAKVLRGEAVPQSKRSSP